MKQVNHSEPIKYEKCLDKIFNARCLNFDALVDQMNQTKNRCLEPIGGTGKPLSEALIFAELGENMLCTEIVLNVQKQFLYTTCSPHVLSLEFSCIQLVIQ